MNPGLGFNQYLKILSLVYPETHLRINPVCDRHPGELSNN